MIFQHTWEKVLSGEKTQTRRLVKAGDICLNGWRQPLGTTRMGTYSDNHEIGVVRTKYRDLWRVWSDYAVQPARTKPAVARIKLLGIERQDVRQISWQDARAEGFTDEFEFMRVWVAMHDKAVSKMQYWGMKSLQERPAHLYDAWVLRFELVD